MSVRSKSKDGEIPGPGGAQDQQAAGPATVAVPEGPRLAVPVPTEFGMGQSEISDLRASYAAARGAIDELLQLADTITTAETPTQLRERLARIREQFGEMRQVEAPLLSHRYDDELEFIRVILDGADELLATGEDTVLADVATGESRRAALLLNALGDVYGLQTGLLEHGIPAALPPNMRFEDILDAAELAFMDLGGPNDARGRIILRAIRLYLEHADQFDGTGPFDSGDGGSPFGQAQSNQLFGLVNELGPVAGRTAEERSRARYTAEDATTDARLLDDIEASLGQIEEEQRTARVTLVAGWRSDVAALLTAQTIQDQMREALAQLRDLLDETLERLNDAGHAREVTDSELHDLGVRYAAATGRQLPFTTEQRDDQLREAAQALLGSRLGSSDGAGQHRGAHGRAPPTEALEEGTAQWFGAQAIALLDRTSDGYRPDLAGIAVLVGTIMQASAIARGNLSDYLSQSNIERLVTLVRDRGQVRPEVTAELDRISLRAEADSILREARQGGSGLSREVRDFVIATGQEVVARLNGDTNEDGTPDVEGGRRLLNMLAAYVERAKVTTVPRGRDSWESEMRRAIQLERDGHGSDAELLFNQGISHYALDEVRRAVAGWPRAAASESRRHIEEGLDRAAQLFTDGQQRQAQELTQLLLMYADCVTRLNVQAADGRRAAGSRNLAGIVLMERALDAIISGETTVTAEDSQAAGAGAAEDVRAVFMRGFSDSQGAAVNREADRLEAIARADDHTIGRDRVLEALRAAREHAHAGDIEGAHMLLNLVAAYYGSHVDARPAVPARGGRPAVEAAPEMQEGWMYELLSRADDPSHRFGQGREQMLDGLNLAIAEPTNPAAAQRFRAGAQLVVDAAIEASQAGAGPGATMTMDFGGAEAGAEAAEAREGAGPRAAGEGTQISAAQLLTTLLDPQVLLMGAELETQLRALPVYDVGAPVVVTPGTREREGPQRASRTLSLTPYRRELLERRDRLRDQLLELQRTGGQLTEELLNQYTTLAADVQREVRISQCCQMLDNQIELNQQYIQSLQRYTGAGPARDEAVEQLQQASTALGRARTELIRAARLQPNERETATAFQRRLDAQLDRVERFYRQAIGARSRALIAYSGELAYLSATYSGPSLSDDPAAVALSMEARGRATTQYGRDSQYVSAQLSSFHGVLRDPLSQDQFNLVQRRLEGVGIVEQSVFGVGIDSDRMGVVGPDSEGRAANIAQFRDWQRDVCAAALQPNVTEHDLSGARLFARSIMARAQRLDLYANITFAVAGTALMFIPVVGPVMGGTVFTYQAAQQAAAEWRSDHAISAETAFMLGLTVVASVLGTAGGLASMELRTAQEAMQLQRALQAMRLVRGFSAAGLGVGTVFMAGAGYGAVRAWTAYQAETDPLLRAERWNEFLFAGAMAVFAFGSTVHGVFGLRSAAVQQGRLARLARDVAALEAAGLRFGVRPAGYEGQWGAALEPVGARPGQLPARYQMQSRDVILESVRTLSQMTPEAQEGALSALPHPVADAFRRLLVNRAILDYLRNGGELREFGMVEIARAQEAVRQSLEVEPYEAWHEQADPYVMSELAPVPSPFAEPARLTTTEGLLAALRALREMTQAERTRVLGRLPDPVRRIMENLYTTVRPQLESPTFDQTGLNASGRAALALAQRTIETALRPGFEPNPPGPRGGGPRRGPGGPRPGEGTTSASAALASLIRSWFSPGGVEARSTDAFVDFLRRVYSGDRTARGQLDAMRAQPTGNPYHEIAVRIDSLLQRPNVRQALGNMPGAVSIDFALRSELRMIGQIAPAEVTAPVAQPQVAQMQVAAGQDFDVRGQMVPQQPVAGSREPGAEPGGRVIPIRFGGSEVRPGERPRGAGPARQETEFGGRGTGDRELGTEGRRGGREYEPARAEDRAGAGRPAGLPDAGRVPTPDVRAAAARGEGGGGTGEGGAGRPNPVEAAAASRRPAPVRWIGDRLRGLADYMGGQRRTADTDQGTASGISALDGLLQRTRDAFMRSRRTDAQILRIIDALYARVRQSGDRSGMEPYLTAIDRLYVRLSEAGRQSARDRPWVNDIGNQEILRDALQTGLRDEDIRCIIEAVSAQYLAEGQQGTSGLVQQFQELFGVNYDAFDRSTLLLYLQDSGQTLPPEWVTDARAGLVGELRSVLGDIAPGTPYRDVLAVIGRQLSDRALSGGEINQIIVEVLRSPEVLDAIASRYSEPAVSAAARRIARAALEIGGGEQTNIDSMLEALGTGLGALDRIYNMSAPEGSPAAFIRQALLDAAQRQGTIPDEAAVRTVLGSEAFSRYIGRQYGDEGPVATRLVRDAIAAATADETLETTIGRVSDSLGTLERVRSLDPRHDLVIEFVRRQLLAGARSGRVPSITELRSILDQPGFNDAVRRQFGRTEGDSVVALMRRALDAQEGGRPVSIDRALELMSGSLRSLEAAQRITGTDLVTRAVRAELLSRIRAGQNLDEPLLLSVLRSDAVRQAIERDTRYGSDVAQALTAALGLPSVDSISALTRVRALDFQSRDLITQIRGWQREALTSVPEPNTMRGIREVIAAVTSSVVPSRLIGDLRPVCDAVVPAADPLTSAIAEYTGSVRLLGPVSRAIRALEEPAGRHLEQARARRTRQVFDRTVEYTRMVRRWVATAEQQLHRWFVENPAELDRLVHDREPGTGRPRLTLFSNDEAWRILGRNFGLAVPSVVYDLLVIGGALTGYYFYARSVERRRETESLRVRGALGVPVEPELVEFAGTEAGREFLRLLPHGIPDTAHQRPVSPSDLATTLADDSSLFVNPMHAQELLRDGQEMAGQIQIINRLIRQARSPNSATREHAEHELIEIFSAWGIDIADVRTRLGRRATIRMADLVALRIPDWLDRGLMARPRGIAAELLCIDAGMPLLGRAAMQELLPEINRLLPLTLQGDAAERATNRVFIQVLLDLIGVSYEELVHRVVPPPGTLTPWSVRLDDLEALAQSGVGVYEAADFLREHPQMHYVLYQAIQAGHLPVACLDNAIRLLSRETVDWTDEELLSAEHIRGYIEATLSDAGLWFDQPIIYGSFLSMLDQRATIDPSFQPVFEQLLQRYHDNPQALERFNAFVARASPSPAPAPAGRTAPAPTQEMIYGDVFGLAAQIATGEDTTTVLQRARERNQVGPAILAEIDPSFLRADDATLRLVQFAASLSDATGHGLIPWLRQHQREIVDLRGLLQYLRDNPPTVTDPVQLYPGLFVSAPQRPDPYLDHLIQDLVGLNLMVSLRPEDRDRQASEGVRTPRGARGSGGAAQTGQSLEAQVREMTRPRYPRGAGGSGEPLRPIEEPSVPQTGVHSPGFVSAQQVITGMFADPAQSGLQAAADRFWASGGPGSALLEQVTIRLNLTISGTLGRDATRPATDTLRRAMLTEFYRYLLTAPAEAVQALGLTVTRAEETISSVTISPATPAHMAARADLFNAIATFVHQTHDSESAERVARSLRCDLGIHQITPSREEVPRRDRMQLAEGTTRVDITEVRSDGRGQVSRVPSGISVEDANAVGESRVVTFTDSFAARIWLYRYAAQRAVAPAARPPRGTRRPRR